MPLFKSPTRVNDNTNDNLSTGPMSLTSADITREVFRFPDNFGAHPRIYAAQETRPDRNSQNPWNIMDQLPSSSKFAGAYWLPLKGEWSQYFPVDQKVIKDQQHLKVKDFTDLKNICPDKVFNLAGTFAMSAVRVSIYDTVTGRVVSFVSGTLVNDDVVTVAHLFHLGLPQGQINDTLDSLSLKQQPNNERFWCIAHPYTNMEGVDHFNGIRLWLVDLNIKDDIAIFRPCPESSQNYEGLEWRSLTFECDLGYISEATQRNGIECFVVGYASDNPVLTHQFRDERKATDPILYDQVIAKPNIRTFYDYIWYNSLETLTTSQEGIIIEKKMRPSDKVFRPFSTLFQPGSRALAVGTIIGKSQDQRKHQGSLTEQWPLGVSCFYGCSGAMVAVFPRDATSSEVTVKMIGMVSAGDWERPFNMASTFTAQGLSWIRGHIEKTALPRYAQATKAYFKQTTHLY